MSTYQLVSCDIALGGDTLNVVARHAFNPVTYAEMLVLRYIHGENSVTSIYDVGAVERDDLSEMNRLSETYGPELIRNKLFPGAGTRLPRGDNRFGPAPPRVVAPDASNASDPVTYEPGVIDYATPDAREEYVPRAAVITDADPFEPDARPLVLGEPSPLADVTPAVVPRTPLRTGKT